MRKHLISFLGDDSGATTVDWVLLTAGVMSLTLAVMSTYGDGALAVSKTLSTAIAERPMTID